MTIGIKLQHRIGIGLAYPLELLRCELQIPGKSQRLELQRRLGGWRRWWCRRKGHQLDYVRGSG
jgi:hypothetical protein